MYIFVDTISQPAQLILFNHDKELVKDITWNALKSESTTLIPNILSILNSSNSSLSDIENFIIVSGPWSFTWARITTIIINTMNYLLKKSITPISYFNLFEIQYSVTSPIVKQASKRDLFVKFPQDPIIKVMSNADFSKMIINQDINMVYWDISLDLMKGGEVIRELDYIVIMNNLSLNSKKLVSPIYIKKPNITIKTK